MPPSSVGGGGGGGGIFIVEGAPMGHGNCFENSSSVRSEARSKVEWPVSATPLHYATWLTANGDYSQNVTRSQARHVAFR